MIDIKTKIHDRFSIEFKVGFVTRRKLRDNNFTMGMWIFIPNSLDINNSTYSKTQFYRDIKSNVRLITPKFLLRDIAGGKAIPLNILKDACQAVASTPTNTLVKEYEYQIRMFVSIVKSSLRDETSHIISSRNKEDKQVLLEEYYENILLIFNSFHQLHRLVDTPGMEKHSDYYRYADEFLCNTILKHVFKMSGAIPGGKAVEIIKEVEEYRKRAGYASISISGVDSGAQYVYRHGELKKYVESPLFLRVPKKRDGVLVEQAYYSVAAGLAMLFATVVAWAFQRRFGNLTWPLFLALIISYMLKDRIKELMRYYFSHRIGSKYFDNKAGMSSNGVKIGYLKEGMDFIPGSKVPKEIMDMRYKGSIGAERRLRDDKVILYRKLIQIDRDKLEQNSKYEIPGINDIIRLQVNSFLRKMDNPYTELPFLRENGEVEKVKCGKEYYITIILQCRYDEKEEFKRFRVTLDRDGIKDISELE